MESALRKTAATLLVIALWAPELLAGDPADAKTIATIQSALTVLNKAAGSNVGIDTMR